MHLPSFAVFTLLCISHLTDAAPVATAELSARGAGQSTPSVPSTAQEMISQGMINTPRKGRAFFWSGDNPPPDGLRRMRNVATTLAEKDKLDYLGSMLTDKGNALVNPIKNKGLTKEFQDQFWDNASEAFAELTTGQVTLMLEGDASTGPPPDSDSVSQRIERPVLEQRLAAGLITGVDRIARDFATTGTKTRRDRSFSPYDITTLCPSAFDVAPLLAQAAAGKLGDDGELEPHDDADFDKPIYHRRYQALLHTPETLHVTGTPASTDGCEHRLARTLISREICQPCKVFN
ncbi:hypothetical protein B0H11DRAFT_2236732 [Mycena galericulata]|nr:hypothetical protein B0H11DRAFT_2236732 [Mycena galericulata]